MMYRELHQTCRQIHYVLAILFLLLSNRWELLTEIKNRRRIERIYNIFWSSNATRSCVNVAQAATVSCCDPKNYQMPISLCNVSCRRSTSTSIRHDQSRPKETTTQKINHPKIL